MRDALIRALGLWLAALVALAAPVAAATLPVDDYAPYQPQEVCRSKVLPGTQEFARWVNRTFPGGTARATLRACGSGGTSEHKDGRAVDWTMSATSKRDRATVRSFLTKLFATDSEGNPHALARRMGVMYVIWNDRIWSSYRQFVARDYLSGGCKTVATCSRTLRHRDHVHISMSIDGGWGRTTWYAGRL